MADDKQWYNNKPADGGKKPSAGLKTAKTVPEYGNRRDAAAGGCVHYRA